MMPSAVTKSNSAPRKSTKGSTVSTQDGHDIKKTDCVTSAPKENSLPSQAESIPEQLQNILEKKIRNLEKRKIKLEGYKAERQSGKPLTDEQQSAVDRLDEVDGQVDMCRDLQKQVKEVAIEVAKQKKVDERKSFKEQARAEHHKFREFIQIQAVLSALRQSPVADDFSAGANGALHIGPDKLKQLNSLAELLFPVRNKQEYTNEQGAPISWGEFLDSATTHALAMVGGSNKKISNTTYKELKSLIDQILHCGYFEKDSRAASPPDAQEAVSGASSDVEFTEGQQETKAQAGSEWASNGDSKPAVPQIAQSKPQNTIDFLQPDESANAGTRFQADTSRENATCDSGATFQDNEYQQQSGGGERGQAASYGTSLSANAGEHKQVEPVEADLSAPRPPLPGKEQFGGIWQGDEARDGNNYPSGPGGHYGGEGGNKFRGRGGNNYFRGRGRGYYDSSSNSGCYRCGSLDHFARDCNDEGGSYGRGTGHGGQRFFNRGTRGGNFSTGRGSAYGRGGGRSNVRGGSGTQDA